MPNISKTKRKSDAKHKGLLQPLDGQSTNEKEDQDVEKVDVGLQVNFQTSNAVILKDKECQADLGYSKNKKRYKSFRTIRNFYSFLKH